MCHLILAGVQRAGLGGDPIQGVGGGRRVHEGGGPTPGIEAAAVDPGQDQDQGFFFFFFLSNALFTDIVRRTLSFNVLLLANVVDYACVLTRDRRKEEKSKKRSKTPPKSYSSARRSRSISRWVGLKYRHTSALPFKLVWCSALFTAV